MRTCLTCGLPFDREKDYDGKPRYRPGRRRSYDTRKCARNAHRAHRRYQAAQRRIRARHLSAERAGQQVLFEKPNAA